jgi:hypothetical protein
MVDNKISNIIYVCVATECKLYLPYLKNLIPDLVILGENKKWKGVITKYKLFSKYLETINDNNIVVFLDAYDVLPTKNITKLEKQFIDFSIKNPDVKMIVGYDKVNNFLHDQIEVLMFGTVDGIRLNSGQYIGYVKNVKHVINKILKNINKNNIKNPDDQIELTNYANKYKNDIYIDVKYNFFYVATYTLRQVKIKNKNYKFSFIHANANGFMDNYLKSEFNIDIPFDIKRKINKENIEGCINKLKMYYTYYFKQN